MKKVVSAAKEVSESIEESSQKDVALAEVLRKMLDLEFPLPGRKDIVAETRLEDTPAVVESDVSRISIGEYLIENDLKTHTDIVLAMAYFLLKNRNQVEFTSADLNALYEEARHPKTNINLAIISNIKKGLMVERGKKEGYKLFSISMTGERYVESNFSFPK